MTIQPLDDTEEQLLADMMDSVMEKLNSQEELRARAGMIVLAAVGKDGHIRVNLMTGSPDSAGVEDRMLRLRLAVSIQRILVTDLLKTAGCSE